MTEPLAHNREDHMVLGIILAVGAVILGLWFAFGLVTASEQFGILGVVGFIFLNFLGAFLLIRN